MCIFAFRFELHIALPKCRTQVLPMPPPCPGSGVAIIPSLSELGTPCGILPGHPQGTPGIQLLKFPFLYKIGSRLPNYHFPQAVSVQQMKASVCMGMNRRFLSQLSGCSCGFSPVDSTGSFAPCYCCMAFLLAQGLFLARDYHNYFSAGLSLPLNRESYYCKNFAETKKIYWTNGKL